MEATQRVTGEFHGKPFTGTVVSVARQPFAAGASFTIAPDGGDEFLMVCKPDGANLDSFGRGPACFAERV